MKTRIMIGLCLLLSLVAFLIVGASLRAADVGKITVGAPPFTLSGYHFTTINAPNIKVASLFNAKTAIVADKICFRYGVTTGTPVQYRVSIQGVNTSTGSADGVAVATGAFTPPAANAGDTLVQCATITNDGSGGALSSWTPIIGANYAEVIEPCQDATAPCSGAATFSSQSSTFMHEFTGLLDRNAFPYAETWNGTSWSKGTSYPMHGLRNSTDSIGFLPESITQLSTISVGAEQAASFRLPAGSVTSYKVAGVQFTAQSAQGSKRINIGLYSGTTVISSKYLHNTDLVAVGGSAARSYRVFFPVSPTALPTLTAGTTYRVGFSPLDASTAFSLTILSFNRAADLAAVDGGSIIGFSNRSGCTGACDSQTSVGWTDSATILPSVQLILTDITSSGGQHNYPIGSLIKNPLDLFALVR